MKNGKPLTLCVVHQGSRVLLGMKKKGFGAGRWNGFGGKLEQGESIPEAAARELREEARIEPRDMEKMGFIEFEFALSGDVLHVHIFKTRAFAGEPTESDEMRPQWYAVDAIPFDSMWPDDKYWMPLFLADKKFEGRFLFGENDTILECNLHEVTDVRA